MTDSKAKKGINDSEKAKEHYTQELFFTKNAEAQRIVDFFNNHFGWDLSLVWKKKKSSRMGLFSYNDLIITLYVGGDSIATLLHEIAHYYDYRFYGYTGHGPSFHKAQSEVIDVFDLNAHKLILESLPTDFYHAIKIIENAKTSGREIENELTNYILQAEIRYQTVLDSETLLDAIINLI